MEPSLEDVLEKPRSCKSWSPARCLSESPRQRFTPTTGSPSTTTTSSRTWRSASTRSFEHLEALGDWSMTRAQPGKHDWSTIKAVLADLAERMLR